MRMLQVTRNERGGGLLMALLVVVALAAIAAGIMSAVSTDRRLSNYNVVRGKALNYAEAGVAEALERIRTNDVPNSRDPKMVAQIYLTTPGNCPTVGADTTAMATAQPAGAWLPYSSDTKTSDVLTVQYMTNAARTGIYYYDATKSPAIQGKTGDPVYLIRSPARIGISRRQIDAAVCQVTVNPNLKAAFTGGDDVKFHGTDTAIGYDYSIDTPSGTGSNGKRDATWETGKTGVPAVWSAKKVDIKSPSVAIGTPSNSLQNQSGFYSGPWDVLNMSQSQFYAWVGTPISTVKSNAPLPSGITYLSKKGDKPQQGTQNFKFKGGSADGFMYVNGDLEISGDFVFRGLIYVEGTVNFKGTGWILGAIVVADHGSAKSSHKNQLTILKSYDAVSQFISKARSPFVTLNWRES